MSHRFLASGHWGEVWAIGAPVLASWRVAFSNPNPKFWSTSIFGLFVG
jgi:hypothetical protein